MEDKLLAYIKYTGEKTQDGSLDARQAAEVFLGIDKFIRFTIAKYAPNLLEHEIEIPLIVRKGSWETWIPDTLKILCTAYATAYIGKLATNDAADKSTKDVLKHSIKSVKWAIKIALHMGTTGIKRFEKVIFKESNNLQLCGIVNHQGEILYVPKEYLDTYTQLPMDALKALAIPVTESSTFSMDFVETEKNDQDDIHEIIIIENKNKGIFCNDAEDEVLFPELKHGDLVELDGHITRGNEKTNNIGFEYKGHVLTCTPENGKINSHKNVLFSNCRMIGHVDRLDKDGNYKEKRPRIIYRSLTPLDSDSQQILL